MKCPRCNTLLEKVVRVTRDSIGIELKIVKYVCPKCGWWKFRD